MLHGLQTFKGEQWKQTTLQTALLFPGVVFVIFFSLNLLVRHADVCIEGSRSCCTVTKVETKVDHRKYTLWSTRRSRIRGISCQCLHQRERLSVHWPSLRPAEQMGINERILTKLLVLMTSRPVFTLRL